MAMLNFAFVHSVSQANSRDAVVPFVSWRVPSTLFSGLTPLAGKRQAAPTFELTAQRLQARSVRLTEVLQ
jgi:hypothetical protein